MFESMAERDSAIDVDQEHAMLRRNQAWLVLCRGYEKPCSWSQAESHCHRSMMNRASGAARL
jgi:hypothetical protein